MEALRTRFEDDTQVQITEGELVALRQRGWPAKNYVKEFHPLAGKLRTWPERLLVHQFHMGLIGRSDRLVSTTGYRPVSLNGIRPP